MELLLGGQWTAAQSGRVEEVTSPFDGAVAGSVPRWPVWPMSTRRDRGGGRIAHTHLKDVNSQIADKVRAGRLSYTEAVVEGRYRPLGTGDVDVDVETIVNTLQGNGYTGWYTLEQDTILTEEPRGEGPVTDVRTSAGYVRSLLTTTAADSSATTR